MFHAKENENLRQTCLDLQLFSLYVQSRVRVWPCVLPSGGEGQTTIVIWIGRAEPKRFLSPTRFLSALFFPQLLLEWRL